MKAWCVPVNLPGEDDKAGKEGALRFLKTLNGLKGICPHESGNTLLVFDRIESARAAKWKLEEFTPVRLDIIEGTLSADEKKLDCKKVLKGE